MLKKFKNILKNFLVPEINFIKTTEEFNHKKDGIWTSRGSVLIYKGIPPFNATFEYGEIVLSDNGSTKNYWTKYEMKITDRSISFEGVRYSYIRYCIFICNNNKKSGCMTK